MTQRDWLSMGVSIGVHLLLLLGFIFVETSPAEPAVGFIEVEMGAFAQGRPVQESPEPTQEPDQPTEEPQPEQVEPEQSPAEDSKPVDVPDVEQTLEDEQINEPETDVVAPEQRTEATDTRETESQPASPRTTGGGQPDGSTGADTGDAGRGDDEEKAAPYVLEGIDRTPVRTRLPNYADKVNAVIQVRITVDPRGRIVRVLPLRKGNASLEQSVMQALRQWQFNPLAPDVPQENQTGTITFRFTLR
ncbi:MAG: TonB family protein [Bacteroidota bacterium]